MPTKTNKLRLTLLLSAALMAPLALAPVAHAQDDAPAAAAQPSATAKDFITENGNQAINLLSTAAVATPEGNAKFGDFMKQRFDLDYIAKFVLGRYAKTATPDQMTEYMRLFNIMVQQIYTERLSGFSGGTFAITADRTEGSQGDHVVTTRIQNKNGNPPISADWRVHPEGDTWKIVDVAVEGVSMSVTQRDEFASVIQRNGGNIDALLAELRKRVDSGNAGKIAVPK